MQGRWMQKGWGSSGREERRQEQKETSWHHTHFAGIDNYDPRVLVILFLLLLFGVNALHLELCNT